MERTPLWKIDELVVDEENKLVIPADWEKRGESNPVGPWKKPIEVSQLPLIRGEAVVGHLSDTPPGEPVLEGGRVQK